MSQSTVGRGYRWFFALILLAMLALSPFTQSFVHGAALLLRFADETGANGFAKTIAYDVDESIETIDAPSGPIRVRNYVPRVQGAPGLVLVHGVHHLGIEEPRLIRFARALSAAGISVMTPEIAELRDYRIAPASIATIGDSAAALSARTGRSKVGVMGLSFAGGLSLMAASKPDYAPRIAFVVAVGAHDRLARVLHFFTRGETETPEGETVHLRAHPYGLLVVAYAHVEDLFAPEDVPVARDTLRAWLWEDRPLAHQRELALSPTGRARAELLFADSRDPELISALEASIAKHEADLAPLSPDTILPTLRMPLLFLHGAGDTVIPPTETRWLAHDAPRDMLEEALVSPVLGHVELDEKGSTQRDEFALVSFMAKVLRLSWDEPR